MTKKLSWQEAAKLMIDGATCIDQYGYEWGFDGSFYFMDGDGDERGAEIQEHTFTLKPEPIKYSVDVWLGRTPESVNTGSSLTKYLLGQPAPSWDREKNEYNKHMKKYRITIEEVED